MLHISILLVLGIVITRGQYY